MSFICAYAPTLPSERMVFLHVLAEILEKCNSEEYLFLGGDFNCVESNRPESCRTTYAFS